MRHHELAAAMRAAGYTVDGLAKAVSVDPKSVGRWLNAGRVPHPRTRTRVAEVLKRDLDDLWPDKPRPEPAWFRAWPEIEREARQIRWFELAHLPGIVQTEAYARTTYAGEDIEPTEVARLVASRLKRQALLTQEHPPFVALVIDYAAVQRLSECAAEVRREQVVRLAEIADLPNVGLHVVPPGVGIYPGLLGMFILADLPGGARVAYSDGQLEGSVTETADAVATVAGRWERIRSVALSGPASMAMIKDVCDG